jgi:hypothetical protein
MCQGTFVSDMKLRFATSIQLGASTTGWQVHGFPGGCTGQLVGNLIGMAFWDRQMRLPVQPQGQYEARRTIAREILLHDPASGKES